MAIPVHKSPSLLKEIPRMRIKSPHLPQGEVPQEKRDKCSQNGSSMIFLPDVQGSVSRVFSASWITRNEPLEMLLTQAGLPNMD